MCVFGHRDQYVPKAMIECIAHGSEQILLHAEIPAHLGIFVILPVLCDLVLEFFVQVCDVFLSFTLDVFKFIIQLLLCFIFIVTTIIRHFSCRMQWHSLIRLFQLTLKMLAYLMNLFGMLLFHDVYLCLKLAVTVTFFIVVFFVVAAVTGAVAVAITIAIAVAVGG